MKAYKATYNISFAVGETYTYNEPLKIGESGFHFCKKAQDVLAYHPYKEEEFSLLEIEVLGDVIDDKNKSITNRFKIIRVVPASEYWDLLGIEVDYNGRVIHYKDSSGYEWWREYDSRGKEIHYKNSNGFEWWSEYDSNGNEIK